MRDALVLLGLAALVVFGLAILLSALTYEPPPERVTSPTPPKPTPRTPTPGLVTWHRAREKSQVALALGSAAARAWAGPRAGALHDRTMDKIGEWQPRLREVTRDYWVRLRSSARGRQGDPWYLTPVGEVLLAICASAVAAYLIVAFS
jgi:hypothetical protein